MNGKYNYKVNYRLDSHPLAPSGFYSYICIADSAQEAKRIVKSRIAGQLSDKVKTGLLKSAPRIVCTSTHRIKEN